MQCRRELLELYIDNRLEATERRELAAHLHICSRCQEELQQVQRVVEMLHGYKTAEPDKQFFADIMRKIECEPSPLVLELHRRRTVGRLLGWASVILAGAVLTRILTLVNGYIGDLVSIGLIKLWNRLMALIAPGADVLGWLQNAKNTAALAAGLLAGNQALLLSLAVSCLLVITMTREIVADVQRVFGHKE